jgi:tRNA U34 5-methylaminomethyl-2-thiouridine-forming methyltransferase MnmC
VNQIVTTADGSHTIYVPELNEHYHSIHGAIQESEFIFIKEGFDFCKADPVNIFEAGFGTGLNALLTAMYSAKEKRHVFYTAIEKYPLEKEIISLLNYPHFAGGESKEILELMHSSGWEDMVNISCSFNLKKIMGDLKTAPIGGPYDLIYFDAFGPDKQPEMWTRKIFKRISIATRKGGAFVTYSAKGDVRRNLESEGFIVTLLPGPPGKRHIIRAIKN